MALRETTNGIFLTGVTGALGSWLAGEALTADVPVVALVRAEDESAARKRVADVFSVIGLDHLSDRVEVIVGDLSDPLIATKLEDALPKSVTGIVHCAASLQFEDDNAETSFQANVEGTRRMMELAEARGLALKHVSSAYVAGKQTDLVREDDLDRGQEFNNVYEETKFEAEKEVRAWAARTGLPLTILRPSIVMGDSQEGKTVRFNGLYDFVRVIDLLLPHLGDQVLRVPTDEHVTKNVIPVDYFAKAAWHIIGDSLQGSFHLTNPDPPNMREIGEFLLEVYGTHYKYDLVKHSDFEAQQPTALEQLVLDATTLYRNYMTHEPRFDRANTDRALAGTGITMPPIDATYLSRLVDYAHSVKWGKLQPSVRAKASAKG
jgi:thioester reductase-like protein